MNFQSSLGGILIHVNHLSVCLNAVVLEMVGYLESREQRTILSIWEIQVKNKNVQISKELGHRIKLT